MSKQDRHQQMSTNQVLAKLTNELDILQSVYQICFMVSATLLIVGLLVEFIIM